jgi:hypothetical protein
MDFVFEWDPNKASANLAKHKVSFEEGRTIFYDPLLVTYPDELQSDKEDRLISIGTSIYERLLLVVHLEKFVIAESVTIRIISCRKATPDERKRYEKSE